MSQSFRVLIASDLPANDRDALVLTLRDQVDLQEETRRDFDPQTVEAAWEAFVAFMKDAGSVAKSAANMVTLAQKLIVLREELRQRGVEPKARFERLNQPPLDFATATDAQIQAWLIQAPPER